MRFFLFTKFSPGSGSSVPRGGSPLRRWVAAVLLGYAGSRLVWARKSLDGAAPLLGARCRFPVATQVFARLGIGCALAGQFPGYVGDGGSLMLRRFSSGSAAPWLASSLARRVAAVLLGYAGLRLLAGQLPG